MSADWWQAILAGVGILVTIVLTFTASAGGRARRRGEQAELAFRLAEQLRGERERHNAERILSAEELRVLGVQIERMDRTARFMASEYSRQLTRDGLTYFWSITLIVYGAVLLLVANEATGNAARDPERFEGNEALPWMILIVFAGGVITLVIGIWGIFYRILRRRRIREAGLRVPGFLAELIGTEPVRYHEIQDLIQKAKRRRAFRAAQTAAAQQQSVGGSGEGDQHEQ